MMTVRIFILYVSFALIATVTNLLSQRLILMWGDTLFFFLMAMAFGALSGLVVKFFLDRRFIFRVHYAPQDYNQVDQFRRYAGTGILTTCLFFLSESIFWAFFQTHTGREIGAVVGLGLGYSLKYKLDKYYVFGEAKE